jgi:hypothetical protein
MSTLIRSVRNETSNTLTIRVPGFNPENPIVLAPSVIVDLMNLLDLDQLESLQKELQGLIDRGALSLQDSVNSDSIGLDDVHNVSETYSDVHSHQGISVDETLAAAAGSATSSSPKFLAAIMGNLFGASLTKAANYLGGIIGAFSITGSKTTSYPAGAVLAQISDGVSSADGAVVAYIDGDSAQTNANAAFKVMNNNSVPGSGFHYGVDLKGSAHDGYPAVAFIDGEMRFSNGTKMTVSGDTITFTNAANTKSFTITMS